MHKITNKSEFVAWANFVNLAPGKSICDLQDVFARSDESLLKSIYLEIEGIDRRIVTFGIYKAMGDETFFQFIRAFARRNAEKIVEKEEERLNRGYDELALEKQQLQDENNNLRSSLISTEQRLKEVCRRSYDQVAKIEQLQEENDKLQSFRDTIIAGLDAKRSDYDKDMAAWNPEED